MLRLSGRRDPATPVNGRDERFRRWQCAGERRKDDFSGMARRPRPARDATRAPPPPRVATRDQYKAPAANLRPGFCGRSAGFARGVKEK
ncbi:hypothetical protein MRX96_007375 [Rhipicephalus microplus]